MKRLWIIAWFLGICWFPSIHADEIGVLAGGSVGLDDSYDAVSFSAFYAGTRAHNGQPLHFYSPLTFNWAVNMPGSLKQYAIQYTPSVEYDIRLMGNKLFGGPTLGFGIYYKRTTGGLAKINQMGIAIVPSLQVKYFVTEQLILRVAPVILHFIPWTYTDNGIGSDVLFALQYQAMAGLSWMF